MKRLFSALLFVVMSVPALSAYPADEAVPCASGKAMVLAGEHARFTVLTPQLIRMEGSEDGIFEDRASLTFINRQLPVPESRCYRCLYLVELYVQCPGQQCRMAH